VLIGLFAFAAVIVRGADGFAAAVSLGVLLIGFGGGFFAVGTLAGAMARERNRRERPGARRLGRGAGDQCRASPSPSAARFATACGAGRVGTAGRFQAPRRARRVEHIGGAGSIRLFGQFQSTAGFFGVTTMQIGAITQYIDVAQIVLYAFWIFFFSLLVYLRREDKREGYPLESDRTDRYRPHPGAGLPAHAAAQDLQAAARR
jgi:hypothetical protein